MAYKLCKDIPDSDIAQFHDLDGHL